MPKAAYIVLKQRYLNLLKMLLSLLTNIYWDTLTKRPSKPTFCLNIKLTSFSGYANTLSIYILCLHVCISQIQLMQFIHSCPA